MSILDNKDTRHEYMCQYVRMCIAFQVRLLRIQRGLTQEQLAEKCETKQACISHIENWDREFPSTSTPRTVAAALDCALIVKFDDWSEVESTLVPPFIEDKP